MDQQPLFYESIYEALNACVMACGGAKVVAGKLWPEKTADAAHRLLLQCLKEDRPEKLDPEQLMFVLRMGRERGFHDVIKFIASDAGYDTPRPIDSEKQAKRLVDVIQQCTQAQTAALKQLQILAELNPSLLRAVS